MVRFVGMLVLLLALFAGFGYYRGWFHASSSDTSGKDTIKMTVDKDKLSQDKNSAEQKVQDIGQK